MLLSLYGAKAQTVMSMEEVMSVARTRSVGALEAKQNFISTYWAYRSYRASLLPSLVLYGNLMNYNRSLVLLQSYEDATFHYASSFNLQNSLGLQLVQNVSLTGGRISVFSDLSRIDQFGANKALTWYSQPITIRYEQPLFSFNSFRWAKLIEPKNYEIGRRAYIESMEQIGIDAITAYFKLLEAYKQAETLTENRKNTLEMLKIAQERMKIGSVTRDEYLQLELRSLNDELAINENVIKMREAQMELNSILGNDESVGIEPVLPENVPEIILDYDKVLELSMENSGFNLRNDIKILNAKADVAKARADRGIKMSLNATFGLSRQAPKFLGVYTNPLDQEIFGVSFYVPIFDWGLGKGKVQKALANEKVAQAQVIQSENDLKRRLFSEVGAFNNQSAQCKVSKKAKDIAGERYSLIMEKFAAGNASVTELSEARKENDAAIAQYINDLMTFWKSYYNIRKESLYDFISDTELDINTEELLH